MKIITKEIIAKYTVYMCEEEKSKNTIEKYLRDIGAFCKYMGCKEIEKSDVLEYKRVLCEKYAPKSVNSILGALNSFFSYMEWYDLRVKTLKIQRRAFSNKNQELTKSEYERLLVTAKSEKNQRLYYLIQTMASTGIRISELCYITTTAVQSGQAVINCKGKIRTVIIPSELCKMLKGYIRDNNIKNGSVFVTKTGKPLDRSYVWRMLKSLCENAGVSRDKVFPHNLRHLFARTYYDAQRDIVRLADILGHSSVNTTRIYTMSTDEVYRNQIQKLGLLRL